MLDMANLGGFNSRLPDYWLSDVDLCPLNHCICLLQVFILYVKYACLKSIHVDIYYLTQL